jgi:hypothetical protein
VVDEKVDGHLTSFLQRKLGTLTDVSGGWMVSAWKEATADYESVDISRPVANILAIKDEQEIVRWCPKSRLCSANPCCC